MNLFKWISKLRLARVSLVAGLMVALGLAAGWSRPQNRADEVMTMLGLKSCELLTIDMVQAGRSEMAITIAGQDYIMDYRFHSNRSSKFKLLVQQGNGELVEQDAPTVSTIRGTLRGVAGSHVTGCITEAGCCAKIQMPSGQNCFIQPVNRTTDNPAFVGVHAVYLEEDVIPSQGVCGNKTNLAKAAKKFASKPTAANSTQASESSSLQECELTVDCDFEYFTFFGSANAALAEMEMIINIVNDQYESEASIRHTISTAIIRANADDPYETTDASQLLFFELRTVGGANTGGFDGDAYHLFTGKVLEDNVLGAAIGGFLGTTVCTTEGFALSSNQIVIADMTNVVAHELGHNWGLEHCDCPNHTMNSRQTSANDFNDEISVPLLVGARDAATCLDSITSPTNDDLASESQVAAPDFSVTGSNINATTEAEEPNLVTVGSSIWWAIDADEHGTLTLDTFGIDFDTQLHVYEFMPGDGLAGLELVESNDNTLDPATGSLSQSQVTFNVTAGTSYKLRVSGARSNASAGDGSEGNIALNGAFVPSPILLGDVNLDGQVDFVDISPFISVLSSRDFQAEADVDESGVVNFLDISPFIMILAGS